MKVRDGVSRAFGGLFAAATLAVIALQGGVAQADDGVINSTDFLIWQGQQGTAAASSDYNEWRAQFGTAGDSTSGDPEYKYISVRRY
jgi:hypothetical protein